MSSRRRRGDRRLPHHEGRRGDGRDVVRDARQDGGRLARGQGGALEGEWVGEDGGVHGAAVGEGAGEKVGVARAGAADDLEGKIPVGEGEFECGEDVLQEVCVAAGGGVDHQGFAE